MTSPPAHRRPRLRPIGIWLAIGLTGLILSGIGFLIEPRQAYASWLAAFAAGLSLALGMLILIAVMALTGARWFDPLRRLALDIAATLPVFALLFLVLTPGLGQLYPWVTAPPDDKAAYLNLPFFLLRAAAYFAIWIGVALRLRSLANRHPRGNPSPPTPSERALSAVGLPALGLSLTFAAFDWLMSLTPSWISTAFGVYWFAGGFLAALAALALVAFLQPHENVGATRLQPRQAYALGALMLTFVVFWAYIAYTQYFIIWIADLPEEIAWYLPRSRGRWGGVALMLIIGHFAVPALVLLFHAAKVNGKILASIAGWLLAMHYLDSYWLVLPHIHPDGARPHWLDLSALAAVAGVAGAWAAWLHHRNV